MMKFKLLGAAAILCSVLAGPAMAQHAFSYPNHRSLSEYCANKEPGNPYDPQTDFQQWTAWRSRGSWDDRGDWACIYGSPAYDRKWGFAR